MKPTEEQDHAIQCATKRIHLKVEAGAGTGKTSTLVAMAQALQPQRGLYLAFNRAMREEAQRRMPRSVTCKTFHALAYAAVGRQYQDRLAQPLSTTLLIQRLRILPLQMGGRTIPAESIAAAVLGTVLRFCQSRDPAPQASHIPATALLDITPVTQRERLAEPVFMERLSTAYFPALAGYVTDLWRHFCDLGSDLPITHDVYLKLWALQEPRLPYAYILFDEAQDANPLMLQIVERQDCPHVYVGDRYQQIYAWRGAENAMVTAHAELTTRLTQSFRFGPAIADAANRALKHYLDVDFGLRGLPQHNSILAAIDSPTLILARTNASAITALLAERLAHRRVALLGNDREFRAFLRGAEQLMQGVRSSAPELAGFYSWDDVQTFAETPAGSGLRSFVRLVDQYGAAFLAKILDTLESRPENADVVVSTVHQAKGQESSRVRLTDDFVSRDHASYTPEEAHLAYVAITRARDALDLQGCSALSSIIPSANRTSAPSQQAAKNTVQARAPGHCIPVTIPASLWSTVCREAGEGAETWIQDFLVASLQKRFPARHEQDNEKKHDRLIS